MRGAQLQVVRALSRGLGRPGGREGGEGVGGSGAAACRGEAGVCWRAGCTPARRIISGERGRQRRVREPEGGGEGGKRVFAGSVVGRRGHREGRRVVEVGGDAWECGSGLGWPGRGCRQLGAVHVGWNDVWGIW